MAVIPVNLGDAAKLSLVLENGDTGQFPQANVYEPQNATPVATVDLGHTAEGLYEADHTPATVGQFNIVYTVYSDAGRTTPNAQFSKELDQLLVTDASTSDISVKLDEIINRLVVIDDEIEQLDIKITVIDTKSDEILTKSDQIIAVLDDIVQKILRVLGLTHENAFIDNTEFDDCDQLISSRLRIFESAVYAQAATDGGSETAGLLATYQVTVDYDGPTKMRTYRMVKL